jgi:plasmid replication initiation protein
MIAKANELIEAPYRLSMMEQKIISKVVESIKMEDSEFKWYTLHMREFLDECGSGKKNIPWLLKIIDGLQRRVRMRTIGKDGIIEIRKTQWILVTFQKEYSNSIKIMLDPSLGRFFLKLKDTGCFTKYGFKNVIRMKSHYSFRIYELLKQRQKFGRREFTYSGLREILDIDETDYKLYGDFKRSVLNTAKKEIEQLTDIDFQLTEIKEGKQVVGFSFSIFKNKYQNIENNEGESCE